MVLSAPPGEHVGQQRASGRGTGGQRLPEPSPHVGPHGWAGKRVREDVRDGIAVAAFSLTASTAAAALAFIAARLGG